MEPSSALGAEIGIEPPLHDAKQGLIGALVSDAAALRPADRAFHRVGDGIPIGGESDDMVELHRDVGADPLLDAHRRLRREGDRPAVEMRAEERPLLGHLHLLGEAEHLKPTTVGEHRPTPSHEPRDSAGRLDDLLAGAEVEVVGIG